jgi:hypothetical protein
MKVMDKWNNKKSFKQYKDKIGYSKFKIDTGLIKI